MVRSRVVAVLGGAFLVGALFWMGCGSSGSDCEPADEVCNGLDDDCDDLVDEGFAVDTSCTNGVGACLATGVNRCAEDGASVVCDAVPGTPSEETCNQLDDDCNGETDDGLEGCCTPLAEQPCGTDEGACTTGAQTCSGAGAWGACLSGGLPVVVPEEETCNGIDDDCNGATDDELDAPECALRTGACAGSTQTCAGPSGWLACGADRYGPSYESLEATCDGLDNDCDGQTDESLSARLCANQTGVCAGSRSACGGASGWLPCGAAEFGPSYESPEATCDGLDNDCDGEADEGVKSTYYRDADGDTYGALSQTLLACSLPTGYSSRATDCDDSNSEVNPGAPEVCANAVDDDCDGQTDGVPCP